MPYAKEQIAKIFRRMGDKGTAPEEGCELFGVGYDDAFKRLIAEYIDDALPAGESAEKFVIGPYGSGKTHFLRHFMTLASQRGCVTAEVQLNKKIDYTQSLIVFREIASGLRAPSSTKLGMANLLAAAIERVDAQFREQVPDEASRAELVDSWIGALDDRPYEFDRFGKILKKALRAYTQKDEALFDSMCRWIQGEVDNRELIKDLPHDLYLTPVKKSDQELFAGNLLLSICQFIRYAGFNGTIIGLDEAEQGLDVNRRRQELIMSMLQANINAVADLQDGSVFILYAFTPELESRFATFPALQQRIDVPIGEDFFENGNTLAAKIDLTRHDDPVSELRAIGHRLSRLFFEHFGDQASISSTEAERHIAALAEQVVEREYDSSNRRTMVKAVCAYLWRLRTGGVPQELDQVGSVQAEV